MCCALCEEPVRSVLFGLSAVGVVAIIRTIQKSVKRFASRATSREQALDRADLVSAADNAP